MTPTPTLSTPLSAPLSTPLSDGALVAIGMVGFLGLPVLGGVMMALGHVAAPLAVPMGLCLGAAAVLALPMRDGAPAPLLEGGWADVDG